MDARKPILALAAVLSATVLTGGAAIAGLVHRPASGPAPAAVVQQVPAAPAAPTWSEGGD